MKKLVLGVMMSMCLVGVANAEIIGAEPFEYPNGLISGLTGGDFWMWNNIVQDHTNDKSAWQVLWGSAAIQGQALYTHDSGALRQYGSDLDDAAFRGSGVVYYSVLFTAISDPSWAGISAYDFDNERIFFGMPGAQDDVVRFGVDQGPGRWVSDIPIELGREYHLICAVDFDGNQVRMWINPDADDWDNGAADNSADIQRDYFGGNWNTGVRLASGGHCRWDNLVVATDFWDVVPKVARAPYPVNGQTSVPLEVTVGWEPAPDPDEPESPNPAITAHRLFTNFDNPNDPNLYFIAEIPNTGERVEYGPFSLVHDTTYSWRVDQVLPDVNDIIGAVWQFETVLSVPVIDGQPQYQVVEQGDTAVFTVTAQSVSPPIFQWYKAVDDNNDIMLTDIGNISGTQTDTLQITDASLDDEGGYYCIVNNASGIETVSGRALLGIKRKIAHWPFEDNSFQSVVPGSPETYVIGQPTFDSGAVGDAMVVRAGLDMIYTDPNQTSYFDICNYSMSVACWVRTTTARTWDPFVARHGEGNQGWQLRQGSMAGRPTFTTRQTGNDDGTRGDRTVADGNWHYVVGTFDGSIKRLYINGVLSRYYSVDTGQMLSDGDAVSGMIGQTQMPVAIAGRVTGEPSDLIFEIWNVIGARYDEVAIYNYALDGETIAQMYADVTGQTVCPEHPMYDLDGDCVVDLNDFAVLASEWLMDGTVMPTE